MHEELKSHIVELAKKDFRLDGRKLMEYRPIKVTYNISKSAEGSARVEIGDTVVLAGVKLEVGEPYPDTPNEGALIVGVELYAISNPEFEPGPPGIQATEIGRVVDRGIRESKAIDMKKLCIKEGEKAWIIIVDICTLNDTGNLFDASALATLAALKNTRLRKLEDDKVNYKEFTDETLPLVKEPISTTIIKIGESFLIDPTTEEELVVDSRLTVAATEDGKICALQKGGAEPLTSDEIMHMVDIGLEKTKELRKAL
jgi:exosome complex component RRP42